VANKAQLPTDDNRSDEDRLNEDEDVEGQHNEDVEPLTQQPTQYPRLHSLFLSRRYIKSGRKLETGRQSNQLSSALSASTRHSCQLEQLRIGL
jgi:hypothetical protein